MWRTRSGRGYLPGLRHYRMNESYVIRTWWLSNFRGENYNGANECRVSKFRVTRFWKNVKVWRLSRFKQDMNGEK
jgi:hypothetical protein